MLYQSRCGAGLKLFPIRTVKGPSELKLSITISPSKSVIDLKEAIEAQSDVEKDRQRLIYSGQSPSYCPDKVTTLILGRQGVER